MKIVTIVGTRPEIIRLSRVIAKLDEFTDHVLVHTGQNFDYELNQIFFDELDIRKPDYFLDAAGENAAVTIGQIIIKVDQLLEKLNPDALLVLGDTNSCLSVIPAKRKKIPVFHMEAGNRCFDQRVPEEINRKIVDHTSDINMPYSTIARNYLLNEGFPADQVIKIGSPMYEVLHHYKDKISNSDILQRLGLEDKKYFIVSTHREENVDSKVTLEKIKFILDNIAKKYNYPIILSTHPRTKKSIEKFNIAFHPLVKSIKPLGFLDYIKLQQESFCVLSDSGTITEESSILDFPAITLREVHERPEGMEETALIMSGLELDTLITAINVVTANYDLNNRRTLLVKDYYAPNLSEKVLRIIISYTNFVNKRVWKKI